MRRLVLAAALWPLMATAALAQKNCPAVLTDCGTINANDGNFGGKLKGRSVVWLSAMDYGLHADAVIDSTTGAFVSGTSDDNALRAALDDCAARNATLVLPPKPILIDGTGGVTAMIQNCSIVGTPQVGGIYSEHKGGTLILLRSKTVAPFHIRNDWSLRGVTFYHPDQVGEGATFTGAVNASTLTTTAVTAVGGAGAGIKPGYLLVGFGVPLGTTIVSQTGGTAGGAGTYALSAGMPTRSNIQMSVSKPADQYPPVLSDDGTVGAGHFLIDDVTFANAYDGIAGTPNRGWGAFFITNFHGWALHDMFRPGFIGDTFQVGLAQLSPGAWFGYTGQSTATKLMINYGEQQNSIFHVQGFNGAPWQVIAQQIGGEAWRWGFSVDSNNLNFTQSLITIAGDSLASVMKVPEGSAFYGFNTVIRGSAGCNVVDWVNGGYVGQTNCFELSSTSSLILSEFLGYAQGDVVLTNGGSVKINGGEYQAGGANDGSDRAIVRLTANTGAVQIQNALMGGVACFQDATQCHHVRGIDTGGFSAALQVQNNTFQNLENAVRFTTGVQTIITGNQDSFPNGPSVLVSGTGPVTWGTNLFGNPPPATLGACGGAGAVITGTLNGYVTVGGNTPTTSCTVNMAFTTPTNTISAWAWDGTPLTVAPASNGQVIVGGAAGADIHGKTFSYDWRGWK